MKLLCCDWTVREHQKMCEERLALLLNPSDTLTQEEAAKLGRKLPEQEVGLEEQPGSCCSCCCLTRVCVCVCAGGEVPVGQLGGAQ